MKLILLATLFALSTAFMLVNSFSSQRNNLFPAAAIFLLMGGFLLTGSGLQVQDGHQYTYKEFGNETVIDTKEPVYVNVKDPIPGIDFSEILGMMFMVMGSGYIVMASPGRFRTILSSR